MKSIAFYNNKGGVGKTTSVINVAHQLALKGKKTLVIDLDGQGNCSRFFSETLRNGLEEVLTKEIISPTICLSKTRYDNIDIITSTAAINEILPKFSAFDEKSREKMSAKLINFSEDSWCSKNYDYIIIDMPPAMNALIRSVLCVCNFVFVPIELGTFSIQGLPTVTDVISQCGTKFGGCFVTKFDKENPSDVALKDMLEGLLGKQAMKSYIPFSRVIKNSTSYKTTAYEYMGWTHAAECYQKLAEEIEERVGV